MTGGCKVISSLEDKMVIDDEIFKASKDVLDEAKPRITVR